MTVKEIVREYLKTHGYDGLFNEESECACVFSNVILCEAENLRDCEAGYLFPCGCGDERHFCIRAKKAEEDRP